MSKQVQDRYIVYPDRIRAVIIEVAYLSIIFGLIGVMSIAKSWIMDLTCLFFIGLFGILVGKFIGVILNKQPLYVFSEEGICDFTKSRPVKIPWEDILKIELIPNNVTFQIGIIVQEAYNNPTKRTVTIYDNYLHNGNLAVYSVIIDGFNFRREPFLNAYRNLIKIGVKFNPRIFVNEPSQLKNELDFKK